MAKTMSELCKSRYERLKEQGICVVCGKERAENGMVKCLDCSTRQRENWAKHQLKKKLKYETSLSELSTKQKYMYTEAEEKRHRNPHCNKCQYRLTDVKVPGNQYGCEYILHTGKRRGCPANKCTHWQDGEIGKKSFNHRAKL